MPHKVGNGAILGIASEDGVAAQKRITLMDRSNLTIVSKTVSDEYGAYAFTGLNSNTSDYLIFAVDDNGNPAKQAIVYDYIQPISAHQGGFLWSNWFISAMTKEPVFMFLGITDSVATPAAIPYGVGRTENYFRGTLVKPNQTSVTPGAANLPLTKVTSGSIGGDAINRNNLMTTGSATKVSAEWVLSTSDVSGDVGIFLARAVHNYLGANFGRAITLLAIKYAPSTHTLTVYRNDGALANGFNNQPTTNLVQCSSYILPIELQGSSIHVACSLHYGASSTLYINGLQVAINDLSGTNVKAGDSEQGSNLVSFIGSFAAQSTQRLAYSQYGTFGTSLFVFYSDLLDAEYAGGAYAKLSTDSIPSVTGYLRVVTEDYPVCFFRLHNQNALDISKDVLRPDAINRDTYLTKAKAININETTDSLVTGGSGTLFSGGGLRASNYFSIPVSETSVTVEFFAKPDHKAAGWSAMISAGRSKGSDAEVVYFEVRYSAGNKFILMWREGTNEVLISFDTVVDTSAIHHYAVTVDKKSDFKASLFIDGVLVEQKPVTSVKFPVIVPDIFIIYSESLSVAGRVSSDLNTISNAYHGYLSELAIYPSDLPAGVIKKHYDERLVI